MIPRGLTARISGFHPGGPGSTPGVGNLLTQAAEVLEQLSLKKKLESGPDKNNGFNFTLTTTN
jgi:hypothetical protein